ncbi:hypothetical protein BUALT_Bualt02G0008500 [Buddleja alternifolia]|uniref:Uncharacterized protein n=1 Tax=Buddleja alternifolia TaxID=168488 RepID=A0AAV6Y7N2_9LAMI|nr:hypothetical protein BUALT_Bualt02G0008500 [Buddleja alternifolia]
MEMWFRWHATPMEACPVIAETLPEGDEYSVLLPHKLFWPLKLTMVEQILSGKNAYADSYEINLLEKLNAERRRLQKKV